ncbi:5-oxoprolinase/urea amidolyase family protein [Microbacterium sp. zg-B96]|uniref:5-oxoprolinase subunit B/C family protein n=1 Tax=Microbacterium sp. zg-B96 TaxID=3049069 RepID=UPI00254D45E6|nr:5-oxoprolinase/urea amidolyase family protein [Microbacterium sp. zg-B96]MCR2784895.1 5-oxoprolinase/urea amidolyase family protein [Microbacterium sp. zg.B96]WIM16434.1 5-oxoprolinase/urea amidolyase family protein [Microbacterium sp. zg-B96]
MTEPGPRILPFGAGAVLAEVATLAAARDLHARLQASRPAGVVDLVPAARTVLVRLDPAVLSVAAARTWIAHAPDAPAARTDAGEVVIPISYDGPDLAETAELLGITAEELVRRHRDAVWTVAFTGFAPGFGYLVSDDWPFDVPRLAAPRTRVPAGSVGLAAGFTGAYPRATPGGWRLIGRTDAVLFDPAAASPALLAPGIRVRFVPAPVPAAAPEPVRPQLIAETVGTTQGLGHQVWSHGEGAAAVEVVAPGPLATVQDLGRAGHAAEGLARSGALDRGALRTANRLLGNAEHAAAIEVTMGGCLLRAARDLVAVVTGAWGLITVDGHAVDPYTAFSWPAGATLELDRFAHGVRAYLAVRGGFDGPSVAGSRATDVLAGLGPPPLRPGDALHRAGMTAGGIPTLDLHPWSPPPAAELELDLAPGPRDDWFAASAHDALFTATWIVTGDADRVGVRLDGPPLPQVKTGELPSEGMVPGALQVPPSGRPTILCADGPVTGGYPVIAVATDAALDALAQARPGMRVRFRHARR